MNTAYILAAAMALILFTLVGFGVRSCARSVAEHDRQIDAACAKALGAGSFARYEREGLYCVAPTGQLYTWEATGGRS